MALKQVGCPASKARYSLAQYSSVEFIGATPVPTFEPDSDRLYGGLEPPNPEEREWGALATFSGVLVDEGWKGLTMVRVPLFELAEVRAWRQHFEWLSKIEAVA